MKPFTALAFLITFAAVLGAGCASLLTKPADAKSFPVAYGYASTNDSAAVAYLEAARTINRAANLTPTQMVVDVILGSALTAAAALGGWMTRDKTNAKIDRQKQL